MGVARRWSLNHPDRCLLMLVVIKSVVRVAVLIALSVLLPIICTAQDIKDMDLPELRKNCTQEIESGSYSTLKTIKAVDLRILAWYRMHDNRPLYVDNALCWAEVTTEDGPKWVLVHMARNPMNNVREHERQWHSYLVFDVPNRWFLYFDKPPRNRDIYERMVWFKFEVAAPWKIDDSSIMDEDWSSALGDKPAKRFSSKEPKAINRER